tara:strand:+ start:230 stop:916 length:687 start_codon:yes stop_codon:yes gene_type:complete
MLKTIGGLLVAWGVLDFVLSWMGTDLYAEIGITIPDAIWEYTAYIVGGIGFALFAAGQKQGEDDTENNDGVIDSHEPSEVPSTPTENGIFDTETECEFSIDTIQYLLNTLIGDEGVNSTHFIYTLSESEGIYAQCVLNHNDVNTYIVEIVGKYNLSNPDILDDDKLEKLFSYGFDRTIGFDTYENENFRCIMTVEDCLNGPASEVIINSLKVFDIPEHQIKPSYIIEL